MLHAETCNLLIQTALLIFFDYHALLIRYDTLPLQKLLAVAIILNSSQAASACGVRIISAELQGSREGSSCHRSRLVLGPRSSNSR